MKSVSPLSVLVREKERWGRGRDRGREKKEGEERSDPPTREASLPLV